MSDHAPAIEPYDVTAEHAAIGAAMVDPGACAVLVGGSRPDDFGDGRLAMIAEAIAALTVRGVAVDAATVASELRASGRFGLAGGGATLVRALECASSLAAAPHYVATVRAYSLRRKALAKLEAGLAVMRETRAEDAEAEAISIAIDVGRLAADTGDHCEAGAALFRRLPTLYADRDAGTRTGLYGIDDMTGGLQRGDLILLAARPSVGKSAMATTIAGNVLAGGQSVAIFSLEVDRLRVAANIALARSGVDSGALKRQRLTVDELAAWDGARERLAAAPLWIDDDPSATATTIAARCRLLTQQRGRLDLVIVDYLQLLGAPKAENRNLEVAAMSRHLKLMARELDAPVLVISQLNRSVEHRDDGIPGLADLRDSGALEQDADVVIMLQRPKLDERQRNPERAREAWARVEKNRAGRTGKVALEFRGECLRFGDAVTDGGDSE